MHSCAYRHATNCILVSCITCTKNTLVAGSVKRSLIAFPITCTWQPITFDLSIRYQFEIWSCYTPYMPLSLSAIVRVMISQTWKFGKTIYDHFSQIWSQMDSTWCNCGKYICPLPLYLIVLMKVFL